MIRLTRCTQASRAGTYFRLHLQTGDSADGPVKPGVSLRPRWFGQGSKLVGLDDLHPPEAKHLTRLGRGLHPLQKARLAPAVNRKRAYYDLTITAPKTVSIAALLRPDHPIARAVLNAHVNAIEKVALSVNHVVKPCRDGHPAIRKWIGVCFHHTHTRETDPHLHTHLVIPNVAQNEEGDWRALQINIGGHLRQRLELRYGHELARQFRLFGLAREIVMRPNGLPEIRSLLPLRKVFSKATRVVEEAGEAAGAHVHPTPSAPAAGLLDQMGRSGLPLHPQRHAIRFRRHLADEIRKPKAKASDDPATLRDEAVRWTGQLTNQEMRAYLDTLDRCDPATQRREIAQGRGTVVVDAPLPKVRDLILHAKRTRLDCHGKNTKAVVFRAIMAEAAGRYTWEELRQGFRDFLADRVLVKARVKEMQNADSIRLEEDRIRQANLAAEGIVIVPLPADQRAIDGARRFPLEASSLSAEQVSLTTGYHDGEGCDQGKIAQDQAASSTQVIEGAPLAEPVPQSTIAKPPKTTRGRK